MAHKFWIIEIARNNIMGPTVKVTLGKKRLSK